jgi:hypothetical protein
MTPPYKFRDNFDKFENKFTLLTILSTTYVLYVVLIAQFSCFKSDCTILQSALNLESLVVYLHSASI